MEKEFLIDGEKISVSDYALKDNEVSFTLNKKLYHYRLLGDASGQMVLDRGERIKASVSSLNHNLEAMVIVNGIEALVSSAQKILKKDKLLSGSLVAPMPGKIFKILKTPGSEVKKGETILILEAMKMEHSIRADKDGRIKKINFQVNDLVPGGVLLAEVES